MATTTTNYGLTKPGLNDNADISVLNANADKIDSTLAQKANITDVNIALNAKANTADMNTALSQKANITDVNTALSQKAGLAPATESANGLMSSTDKTKLDGVAAGANNYVHPTGDGNMHVPATGTTNGGKVLKAGSTAGSAAWAQLTESDITNLPADLAAKVNNADIVNNLTTTTVGKPLDASQGNKLQTEIDDFEQMITQEANTPEISNTSPIVSVGKGKDATGVAVDYHSSVINGIGDYTVKGNTMTNLLINSNFSNDTTGWTLTGNTTPILNTSFGYDNSNSMRLYTTTSSTSVVRQEVIIPTGHKVYVTSMFYIKSIDSVFDGIWLFDYGSYTNSIKGSLTNSVNVWQRVSAIKTVVNNGIRVDFGNTNTLSIRDINVDCCIVIDLTATFGAGNEPSQADMDAIMSYYPNSWFNGTVSVRDFRMRNCGTNLFDKSKAIKGYVINTSDGTIQANSSFYASDYIRVKPNIQYAKNSVGGYAFYDASKIFISGVSSYTSPFTTPANCCYIRTSIAINIGENIDNIQIELGSTATAYEPYQENINYIETGSQLRSLPNGICDTVASAGTFTQNMNMATYNGSEVWGLYSNPSNGFIGFFTPKPADAIVGNDFGIYSSSFNTDRNAVYNNTGEGIASMTTNFYIAISTSKLNTSDVTGFKAWLASNPVTICYQLATPIITKNQDINPMEVYENGTTIIEPIVKKYSTYTTKITITDTTLPIKSLVSVSKVVADSDGEHETPIDLSTCTVASDGLSFTSTVLTANDEVKYVYAYDASLSAVPTISASYAINTKAQIDSNTKYAGEIYEELEDTQDFMASHVADTVSHITSAERTSWNGALSNSHTHSNMTALNAVSGTNTGNETVATIGTLISNTTEKATPVDTDMVGLMDSGSSNILKKLSWSNIKATVKSYFDTLYAKATDLTNHTGNALLHKQASSNCVQTGSVANAEGNITTASGFASHSGGSNTTASGQNSFSMGDSNVASGVSSFAIGSETNAINYHAFSAGCNTTADFLNYVIGRYNKAPTACGYSGTTGDAFTIGNGNGSSLPSNAFRVTMGGAVYGLSAFNSTGADYAEYIEWEDENTGKEDRTGLFAVIVDEKMRLANDPSDDIDGIISAVPAVVGDNYADDWKGKYKTDIFGRRILEHKTYDAVKDADGNIITPAYEADEWVLNPDYDATKTYIPREQRPEFSPLGIVGKLVLIDDGTCVVGGYATAKASGNGIGTASTDKTRFKVMKRIDTTHVLIFVK